MKRSLGMGESRSSLRLSSQVIQCEWQPGILELYSQCSLTAIRIRRLMLYNNAKLTADIWYFGAIFVLVR